MRPFRRNRPRKRTERGDLLAAMRIVVQRTQPLDGVGRLSARIFVSEGGREERGVLEGQNLQRTRADDLCRREI